MAKIMLPSCENVFCRYGFFNYSSCIPGGRTYDYISGKFTPLHYPSPLRPKLPFTRSYNFSVIDVIKKYIPIIIQRFIENFDGRVAWDEVGRDSEIKVSRLTSLL